MEKIENIIASLIATLKVVAFFILIIALVPVALVARRIDPARPYRVPNVFHRLLLKLLGIRLRMFGAPCEEAPVLFVANHTSYLDVPVLGAVLPACFVAKADVSGWPLFGFLARVQNTVFIERRSTRAAEQRAHLQNILAQRQNLTLFPEGTSTDGLATLPFKSSLFGIVEDSAHGSAITVQPISVTCTEMDGLPMLREDRARYAWYGDMTLVPHLWEVFKNGTFTVEIIFHAPLTTADYPDRKSLAAACQKIVAQGVEQSLTRHELASSAAR